MPGGKIFAIVAAVIAVLVIASNATYEIKATIRDMILERPEAQDIGIQLVNITIQDSQPPTTEVMEAFKAVETAKQGKETALNNANKYRNGQIPSAQAARFNAIYEEYIKNPTVTRQRMFFEAMEDILPDVRSLDALKISMQGGNKTVILSPDSPIAQIFYGN